jgi:uncharacterized membrane protein
MHSLTSTFLRGLGVVLPIALTGYLVFWIATTAETLLKPLFGLLLPNRYYIPGSGLVLAIVLIYLVGLLVQLFVIERLVRLGQRILARTPLVKSIYNAINDFVSYFSRRPSDDASTVVSVQLDGALSVTGFVTNSSPTRLIPDGDSQDRIAVYLPMSYQIGGYTVLVPRERVRPLPLGAEEAMRLVLTAGVASRSSAPKP